MQLFRFAVVAAALCAGGCLGHHHWEKAGASHEESHRELERCQASSAGSSVKVEECMEEKGFEVDHHHLAPGPRAPAQRPALEALPRLPTY